MVKARIVGAAGYGGVGLTELMSGHPEAEIVSMVDVANIGKSISDMYPHLHGFCDLKIIDVADERASEPVDVVFMATPDGVGMKVAPGVLETGAKVVDYSGDFRFNSAESYAEYAVRIGREPEHASPDLLPEAVYGLAELHREEATAETRIIGNPGCFAVSCILGLAPAVANSVVDDGSIICDCKTGVSGAGRAPADAFHFPARYEHMNAYKLTGHQHVCEVERELGLLSGKEVRVTFTTQVVPLCRGIMSTLYGTVDAGTTRDDVVAMYREFYSDSPFVRVYGIDSGVGSCHVRGTNYCALIVDVDERTQRLRIVSHIDNLVKGQAGSALQNMNLLFGLPETMGLDRPGQYP
jgi:N-acetyl-gamma-glutamyl-phosphate reductase